MNLKEFVFDRQIWIRRSENFLHIHFHEFKCSSRKIRDLNKIVQIVMDLVIEFQ